MVDHNWFGQCQGKYIERCEEGGGHRGGACSSGIGSCFFFNFSFVECDVCHVSDKNL